MINLATLKTGSLTLLNKTLTSPKINENVALVTTATELNFLNGFMGKWIGWNPTYSNLTIGNASQGCEYVKFGKFVCAKGLVVFGNTSSMGTGPVITNLPFSGGGQLAIGNLILGDKIGFISSTGEMYCQAVSGSYIGLTAVTATVPFTWTTGSNFRFLLVYEAA